MPGNDTFEKLLGQITAWIDENGNNATEKSRLARKLYDRLAEKLLAGALDVAVLAAPNAVVEIIDRESGLLYRRYLELGFEETGNGLRLMGDDIGGKPVQIVYLSNAALEKLHDLSGRGPDTPRCDGH